MNKWGVISIMGIYTLVIVYGIHYYEAKLKDLNGAISDYKRALEISKHHSNAHHYTQLQLDNKELRNQIVGIDKDNQALQVQLKALKSQLAGNERTLQYESYMYKNNSWD